MQLSPSRREIITLLEGAEVPLTVREIAEATNRSEAGTRGNVLFLVRVGRLERMGVAFAGGRAYRIAGSVEDPATVSL